MKKGEEKDWKIPNEIIAKYQAYQNKELEKLTPEDIHKNGEFEVEPIYEIIEVVGRGAYGTVVAAKNK